MYIKENVTITNFKRIWSEYTNKETINTFSTNSSGTYTGTYHNASY